MYLILTVFIIEKKHCKLKDKDFKLFKLIYLIIVISFCYQNSFSQIDEAACIKILNECINNCDNKYIEFEIDNNTSDSIVVLNKFFKASNFDKKILYPNSNDRTNIILFTQPEIKYMEFSGEYLPDYSEESQLFIIPPFSKVNFYASIKLDSIDSKINTWKLKYFLNYAKLKLINELIEKNSFEFSDSFFLILKNNDSIYINIIEYNSIPNPDINKINYNINFLKSAFINNFNFCKQ